MEFSGLKWKVLGLVVLLVSFVPGRVAKAATTEVEKGAQAIAVDAASVETAKDSLNDASDASDSGGHADAANVAAIAEGKEANAPWRKNVKFLLSDSVPDAKNCEKTLEIQGLPENIEVNWLRVWTDKCSMSGTSNFIGRDFVGEDSAEKETIIYDKEKKSYKTTFTPLLDAKCTGCRNLFDNFDMGSFHGILFLKDKATGEPVSPISFEVSNKGLKMPERLVDFRNFKVEVVQDNDESFLKIYGIPNNVSEIYVTVEEGPGKGKEGPWNRVINERRVSRSEQGGWNFITDYRPKNADGEKLLLINFSDDDGYRYLVTELF